MEALIEQYVNLIRLLMGREIMRSGVIEVFYDDDGIK